VEIRYTKRAERDLLDGDIGWRTHHPSRPAFFADEMKRILELLATQPLMGRRTNRYRDARVFVAVEVERLIFYRVYKRHIMVRAVAPARAQRNPLE
jgi:plasmid stabilization system protein ParE